MSKKYIGVIPPVVTPVDADENVDEAGFRKLISHCIDNGLHGIFVAGSNGECLALTQAERDRAIGIAIDEAAGRVPVMAGTMDSSTRRVIENTKRLEQMGGTCAVVTPVFYARHATQDESVRHFEEIARHTSIDLMIYNIPPFTGQTLKPDTIFKIAEIDKVVGYKDTSGLLPDFMRCLAHFKGTDFILHQGATNLAVPSMLLGADGYIPSLAPLFPLPHVKLYDHGRAGDIAKTKLWGEIVDRACTVYPMAKSQTSSTKFALSRLGFFDKRPIRPTEPVRADEEKAISARIDEVFEMIRSAEG
ncbi:MAG: dihydrodipicolinate synthase family protein [Rhodoplanes sp.]|uniref:dihydrodipicolinate synthase family protein n=1 Tax=Rhodoplanes sp. TaxID=1968906 RepID=UPI0017F51E5F|nr:dihydrodipicolinate synthase family protein [Rhodoplanes sp.]NVO14467.1 dihydrodipicolinate synthase family protein [Rhodoplanes sp.]